MKLWASLLRTPGVRFFIKIFTSTRLRIEGNSMSPTYSHGDHILVDKEKYHHNKPKRGDVVLFHHPVLGNKQAIKRVIGLPGELIRATNYGSFSLEISMPNVENLDSPTCIELLMEKDEYFLIGDNAIDSLDSRRIGPVKLNLIRGKVWFKYWPINFRV